MMPAAARKASPKARRPGPGATSADAFFGRISDIEGRLEAVLDDVDSCFASQALLSTTGGATMTAGQRRKINTVLAFDLQGLRRAVAAAQSIALCGPDDAAQEAAVAPMLAARGVKP